MSIIRKCLSPRIAEDMSEVTPPMVSVAFEFPYVLDFFLTNQLFVIDHLALSLIRHTSSLFSFAGRVVQRFEAALRSILLRQCPT